jgi:hypothetical protein
MSDERKQTYGEELSDLLYGLQITVKIMESINTEHNAGKRDQIDFEARWVSQTQLLLRNLAKVKPLVESFVSNGFNKFEPLPVEKIDATE